MRQAANRSKESREFEDKDQTARKGLGNLEQAANRSKEIRKLENKEQAARKGLENSTTREHPLERQ